MRVTFVIATLLGGRADAAAPQDVCVAPTSAADTSDGIIYMTTSAGARSESLAINSDARVEAEFILLGNPATVKNSNLEAQLAVCANTLSSAVKVHTQVLLPPGSPPPTSPPPSPPPPAPPPPPSPTAPCGTIDGCVDTKCVNAETYGDAPTLTCNECDRKGYAPAAPDGTDNTCTPCASLAPGESCEAPSHIVCDAGGVNSRCASVEVTLTAYEQWSYDDYPFMYVCGTFNNWCDHFSRLGADKTLSDGSPTRPASMTWRAYPEVSTDELGNPKNWAPDDPACTYGCKYKYTFTFMVPPGRGDEHRPRTPASHTPDPLCRCHRARRCTTASRAARRTTRTRTSTRRRSTKAMAVAEGGSCTSRTSRRSATSRTSGSRRSPRRRGTRLRRSTSSATRSAATTTTRPRATGTGRPARSTRASP